MKFFAAVLALFLGAASAFQMSESLGKGGELFRQLSCQGHFYLFETCQGPF